MKFEKINGKNYVLMEPEEELHVAYFKPGKKELVVKSVAGGLDLVINEELLNSFKKTDVPANYVNKDNILIFCEEWFDLYRKTYDRFKRYAIGDNNSPKDRMKIDLSTWYTYDGRDCKCLYLNLGNDTMGDKVRGAKLVIENNNFDVFKYLFALVFDHYINENFKDTYINEKAISYTLGSTYSNGYSSAAEALFISIRDVDDLEEILSELINNHNNGRGISTEELIYRLRTSIKHQEIDMNLLKGFYDESRNNYMNIPEEVEKLKKSRKFNI